MYVCSVIAVFLETDFLQIPPKKNWSSDEENSGQGADDDDDDDAEL